MITFEVEDGMGLRRTIEVPEDINLNVMEVLRASDYPIAATCGGLALCATCYVEVVSGIDQLEGPTDVELDLLDTLPAATAASRLSCQMKVSPRLEGVTLKLNMLHDEQGDER